MANSSTITRNTAAPNTTTYESDGSSSWAYAHYSLDQALTSATQINVSMIGSGGATAADFGVNSFQYQIGTFNAPGPWTTTSNNGPITLNAGHTNFNLRVLVASDNLAETGEGVTFVVSQTAASVGLINSYWVPAQVDIFDPIGKGASALPRTIMATGTVPGEEDMTPGLSSGTAAQAIYSIDGGAAAGYADAQVKLSVTTGLGGSSTADYTALYYSFNGGATSAFNNNALITIPATATSITLSASLLSDDLTESGEQLLFTVSQTANSIGLVNSWAVQNIVDLKDPANAGANVHTRTITADTVQTGIEGTGTTTPAMATYKMEYGVPGGGHATDVVKVGILTGLGGSSAADYTNFSYSVNGGGTWTLAASTNYLATIPAASTAQLFLRAEVNSDLIAEAGEQLVFTVSQTAIGPSLTNSWWVPSTVDIRDANGTGATAISRTITAGSPVTGIEGSLTTLARANYNLVDGATGTGYSNAVVKVGIVTGLGGSSTADYTDFSFTYSWTSGGGGSTTALVDSSGLVTIPASATSFYLSAKVASDLISESSEQLMFTVSNTGASPAITDSFWVPNIVNLQDAPGTGAVANPRHIIVDTLATTGMEGSSDWNINTSPAIATFTVTYDGGAGSYGDTEVHVSMFGAGGASAADYSSSVFKFREGTPGNYTPWADVVNGLVTVHSAATSFQLASLALTDQIAETGEGITFAVSQTAKSIGLVDSWWVTSTADIADVAAVYTIMTGANGADIFTGTSAREMFTIPGGSSLLQTGGFNSFDRIDNYVVGSDKIDLPITVTGILSQVSGLTADNLILLLTPAIPTLYVPGGQQVVVYTVTDSLDRYLAIDSDGTSGWNPLTDTFIRLVGLTGTLTTADFG